MTGILTERAVIRGKNDFNDSKDLPLGFRHSDQPGQVREFGVRLYRRNKCAARKSAVVACFLFKPATGK
jgi:hypothetical protein